jgi:hypothetical protein
MYRWHRLGLLLLVAVLGLSGCQSAVRISDPFQNSLSRPFGEDKGSDFQIQRPGEYAVWQALVLKRPSNYDSIDLVAWSFQTDIYPASSHSWNTQPANHLHPYGPWHMQNSWITLYEPGGTSRVNIEFGFVLRKGDLPSGHWAWYHIFGSAYMDDAKPNIDYFFRNCYTSSVQTVWGYVSRFSRNADGTWKWKLSLGCNNGGSTVMFNTPASAIIAHDPDGLGMNSYNPFIWAEWEDNICPRGKPNAWRLDRFSNSGQVFFRSVFYMYVPRGEEWPWTRLELGASNFDVAHLAGASTQCISRKPAKGQLSDGRIFIRWR